MGAVYTIVLDSEDPGFDTFVNGKAIARAARQLVSLCDKLGLPAFDEFLTFSEQEIIDLLDEDIRIPESEEAWFSPDDGLRVIDALSGHLKANPRELHNAQGVLEDLAQYANILAQARSIGARWHLGLEV